MAASSSSHTGHTLAEARTARQRALATVAAPPADVAERHHVGRGGPLLDGEPAWALAAADAAMYWARRANANAVVTGAVVPAVATAAAGPVHANRVRSTVT